MVITVEHLPTVQYSARGALNTTCKYVLRFGYDKVWLLSTVLLLEEEEVLRCEGVILPLHENK